MRQRHLIALLAALLCTTLLLLRQHFRNLAEVVTTYATFYPYLRTHPEVLYHYGESNAWTKTASGQTSELVPRIIHQIYLTEGRDFRLDEYDAAITSCQDLHPNWTHNLWIDDSASAFIEQYYPELLPHYLNYDQSIQRANILQYAVLERFGGVYLDLDVTCLHPLDDLRHLPFVSPGAYPAGVNNAFVLARPNHSFLKHLLDGVGSRNLLWGMPYVENMLSTGCMFFSNRWMSYIRGLSRKGSELLPEDRVYILADDEGRIEPHMLRGAVTTPLFKHGGASSWHGWDAAFIVTVGQHYYFFLAMMALGAVFAIIMTVKLSKGSEARRRSWSTSIRGSKARDKNSVSDDVLGRRTS